jgi:hypothetical protein
MVGYGRGCYMKSVGHDGPDFAISKRVLAKLSEVKLKDITCVIAFHYLSKSTTKGIPNGTMAFNRAIKPTALVVLQWDNAIHDHSQEAREIAHDIASGILGDKSLLRDPLWFGYGNYGERPGWQSNDQSEFKSLIDGEAPAGMKDSSSSAFGPSYPRLQGIKKKYDPGNVFNKWFPIVPA